MLPVEQNAIIMDTKENVKLLTWKMLVKPMMRLLPAELIAQQRAAAGHNA